MNEPSKPNPFLFLAQTTAAPATRNYLFIAAACLALNFFVLAGDGLEMVAILATLVAVPGVAAKWVISPFLYLFIVGYNMLDPGFFGLIGGYGRLFGPSTPALPRVEHMLLAASTFGYLVCQFRLLTYWTDILPSRLKKRGREPLLHDGPQARPLENTSEAESLRLLWEAPILLTIAFLLYAGMQIFGDFIDRSDIPVERNLAMLGLLVLTIFISLSAIWLAAAYSGGRSRQTARLALMDILFQETRREQQRLARWRLWNRERAVRKGRGENE